MRDGAHSVLAASARFYTPLVVLFALTLLLVRAPGEGVGLVAGLAFMVALTLHALVFGAGAARAAAPAPLMRALLGAGLAAAVFAALSPRMAFAGEVLEAGLFVLTASGGALVVAVLFGRASTMRDQTP